MLGYFPWAKREVTFDGRGCKRGDKIPSVRLVQEWLTLRGFCVLIDSDFGPATERAVRAFQNSEHIPETGEVDQSTFSALTVPLQRVLTSIQPDGKTLGQLIVAYAIQHLSEHPLEVGGQNRGPWVRLYMEGNEGKEWAWCAGFVCFLMRQAACSLNQLLPIKPTFSCDELVSRAQAKGFFVSGLHLSNPLAQLSPGSIFLNRKNPTDWTHTGIVISVHEETFETIEGNTNDNGDREGYEVCRRIRSYDRKDFICIP
jgi:hypothetical protein